MSAADILNDMADALKGELSGGYSEISSFVQSQGKLLAEHAELIATERVSGSLKDNDEGFEFHLGILKDNTVNLARSVAMLTALTIEKAWNAVANVLWGGIRSILSGAGVPDSLLPETPPSA